MPPAGPLISIALPTRNGARHMAQSLQSILAQTMPDFEVIVVDGGSTDGTLDIVAAAGDPRIRIVDQPANSGRLPGALNLGFGQARGRYFTWAQDDDWYEPQALATLAAGLEAHPQAGLVYTGMVFVDEAGALKSEALHGPPESVYWTNPVGHCFLYRRAVAEQIGGYDARFLMAEDFHYWLRIYRQAGLAWLPGRHYAHRLHADSLTMRAYGQYEARRVCARARREVLGISRRQYQRQVSEAYIEEAFAAYAAREWQHVRRCLLRGLARNPLWLRNRGVVSIAAQSALGRERRQPAVEAG